MFDGLEAIGAAWRTIAHISEWSGLSIGVLMALGAVVYFDPKALKLAIVVAINVLIGWACLVHGHNLGVADEDAKLITLSKKDDARAADAAQADESARVDAIEKKAKEQHDSDLAEIAYYKTHGGGNCVFDPDVDAGGVQQQQQASSRLIPLGNKPKPAAGADPADKGTSGPAFGRLLHLPLVWDRGVQGKGRGRNAAPDSQ